MILLLLTLIILTSCANNVQEQSEAMEMACSDIISEVVTGYKTHWSEFTPSDCGLSAVYCYESAFGAFARTDIDGDGIEELLLGDDFGGGNYFLYDIFTFDAKTGNPVHLLSGGERDSFVVSGDGTIIEHGSSGADCSFTKFYKIEGCALKEVEAAGEDHLMDISFEPIMRYVAPCAYVAEKNGELQGRLVKTYDEEYLIEVQDTVRIPKEGVDILLWSAFDGKGVVFPENPGEYPVYASASEDSEVKGKIVYEEGYVPDVYACLGYAAGWFIISFEDGQAYVKEGDFSWDCIDSF